MATAPPPGSPAQTTAKRYRDGTHRLRPPEETWAWIQPMLPSMGITRVANITGLDVVGIPVVTAVRPNARSLAVSQGKGTTLVAAKVSAAMEALEMFHAEHIEQPLRLASFSELRRTRSVVDVARLPRSAAATFHPDRKLLWVEGEDLIAGRPKWVPYELVHCDFTPPLPPGSGAFLAGTNGLASGNHLYEAVSHGLCEVIERDARTLAHAAGEASRDRRRLDLATIDDALALSILERFERAKLDVALWEITSDVGVPAFECHLGEREPSPFRPSIAASGMGCHPGRGVALLRALTEAAQTRLTVIAGTRDDWTLAAYRGNQDRETLTRMVPPCPAAMRRWEHVPDLAADTIDRDVVGILERLHARGIEEAVVVDLTRAELGVPVARVVVPGLEGIHDAPGYTPGTRARQLRAGAPA